MNFNHQAEEVYAAIGVSAERYHELSDIAKECVEIYINDDADSFPTSRAYQIVMESGLTGVEQLLLFDHIRWYEFELTKPLLRIAKLLLKKGNSNED